MFRSLFVLLFLHAGAEAAMITISFNEYPFPVSNTVVSSTAGSATASQAYNLLHDTTMAALAADNGDQGDLTISTAQSAGALGASNTQWQTNGAGRYTATRSFTGTVAANNPGTLAVSELMIRFGSHLSVTNLTAVLSSLNSAGLAWEYTMIGYLRPDGTAFSAAPVIGPYLSHTAINGSPSAGWFVADSKGTVTGVGTASTAAGTSGTFDNMTLSLAAAGLAPNTQVGGIVIYFVAQDVRGTATGASNFTGSLTEISFDAVSAVPEPGSMALAGIALAMVAAHRKLRKR